MYLVPSQKQVDLIADSVTLGSFLEMLVDIGSGSQKNSQGEPIIRNNCLQGPLGWGKCMRVDT